MNDTKNIKKITLTIFTFCLVNLVFITLFKSSAQASTTYFIHSDHLGSVSMVTDSGGNVVSNKVYYPYGETRTSEGSSPTERQYTGQVSDMDESGLYYYNARYYNPVIAKFTQADTVNDGLNSYSYVGGNPIINTDPSGNAKKRGGGSGSSASSTYLPSRKGGGLGGSRAGGSLELTLEQKMNISASYNGARYGFNLSVPDINPYIGGNAPSSPPVSPEDYFLSTGEGLAVAGVMIAGTLCAAAPHACLGAILAIGSTDLLAPDTQVDVMDCASGNLASCATALIPGITNTLWGKPLSSGYYGTTYVDETKGIVTKIFNKPNNQVNLAQINWMKKYGGKNDIPAFIGEIPGGFQMEYIPGVTLSDFIANGGKFTQDEVNKAIVDLYHYQALTGQAHGDLVRQGYNNWVHGGNVLIQTTSKGNTIRLIDPWPFPRFQKTYLTNPSFMIEEVNTYGAYLNNYVGP